MRGRRPIGIASVFVALDSVKGITRIGLGTKIPPWLETFAAGFAGGVIQGVMGTGGPMLATYFGAHARSIAQFRASVIGIFFIANALRLVVTGAEDVIAPDIVHDCLVAAPFFLLSAVAGNRVTGRMDKRAFHLAINILLVACAVSMLVKQFA